MRIRILWPTVKTLDGVDLSAFHPGQLYEVDRPVAMHLILSGVAEPCREDSPALVVRTSEKMVGVFAAARQVRDVADDYEDDEGPGAA